MSKGSEIHTPERSGFYETLLASVKIKWDRPYMPCWSHVDERPYNVHTNQLFTDPDVIDKLASFKSEQGFESAGWVPESISESEEESIREGEKALRIAKAENMISLGDKAKRRPEQGRREYSDADIVAFKTLLGADFPAYAAENLIFKGQPDSYYNVDSLRDQHHFDFKMPDSEASKIIPEMEALIAASPAKIYEAEEAEEVSYDPESDSIHMPPRESFGKMQDYYHTAAYLIAHSMMDESRCDCVEGELKGKLANSKEMCGGINEVRAQVAALKMQSDLGLNITRPIEIASDYIAATGKSYEMQPQDYVRSFEGTEEVAGSMRRMVQERMQDKDFSKNVDDYKALLDQQRRDRQNTGNANEM